MATKTKAACGSGNYQHAKSNVHAYKDSSIITDFERSTLIVGVIFAITFGLMFIHAAVM